MPFVLLTFGAILLVAGVRGKNNELWALVKGDFTGQHSFIYWVVAVGLVGGVGYVKVLRPISIAFLTLLLIVLFLSNKGVIAQLQSYVQSPGNTATPPNASGLGIKPLPPLPSFDPVKQIQDNLSGFQ